MNNSAAVKATKDVINDVVEKVENVRPINERIEENLAAVQSSVATNLSSAAEKVHAKSDSAQDVLNLAADKLYSYEQNTIGKVNNLGHRTADILESSAGYIKDFDLQEARDKVVDGIVSRPAVSLGVAAILCLTIGFVIGRKI